MEKDYNIRISSRMDFLIDQNKKLYEMVANLVANGTSNKPPAVTEPEMQDVSIPSFPITTLEAYQAFNKRLLNNKYAQQVVSANNNMCRVLY